MKNIIRYISITGVFIVFALLASCKSDNNSTFFPGNDKFAGNKQMADSLTAIYKRTDFYNHPYEKSEFIKMLEKELSAMHNVPINKMINYAIELTRGGEIDKAIAVLEKLFAEVPDIKSINKQNKWVYELLAIAYMRKGEVDNCIMNHNEESCLFPIKGKGIHQAQTGSSAAIKLYSQILDKFPEDLQSQYLINLAYMTLGKFPDDVPKKWLLPLNKLTSSGNMPKFENIAIKLGFAFNELSGGVIMDDFDNDGFKDVIISSWGMKDQLRYFRNKGDGSFEDRTKEAGLIGLTGGLNMKQADIDNDGNLDFFVLRGSWKALTRMGIQPNSLLRNNGDGTFSDITIKAGLYTIRPTQTAEFFDFNNDGLEDIFASGDVANCIEVWRAKKASDNRITYKKLRFNNSTFPNVLSFLYGGFYTQVYVSWLDIPAIIDMDGDGDLDIASFEAGGGQVILYKNRSDRRRDRNRRLADREPSRDVDRRAVARSFRS